LEPVWLAKLKHKAGGHCCRYSISLIDVVLGASFACPGSNAAFEREPIKMAASLLTGGHSLLALLEHPDQGANLTGDGEDESPVGKTHFGGAVVKKRC